MIYACRLWDVSRPACRKRMTECMYLPDVWLLITVQCVAVRCRMLQCVAVCCRVLQCTGKGSRLELLPELALRCERAHRYIRVCMRACAGVCVRVCVCASETRAIPTWEVDNFNNICVHKLTLCFLRARVRVHVGEYVRACVRVCVCEGGGGTGRSWWVSYARDTILSNADPVFVRECVVCECVVAHCSVLQSVAVCCSVLKCVVACCSVLQCVEWCCSVWSRWVEHLPESRPGHSTTHTNQNTKQTFPEQVMGHICI